LDHSMGVKRRQGGGQGDLFDEAFKAALRHGASGEGGPGANEEPQAPTAWDHERALTRHLMEAVSGAACCPSSAAFYRRG